MTTAHRIKKLEAEIADLKARLAVQEARPFLVTMPASPANPWSTWPSHNTDITWTGHIDTTGGSQS